MLAGSPFGVESSAAAWRRGHQPTWTGMCE